MSQPSTAAKGLALAAALTMTASSIPAMAQPYGPPPGYQPGYAYGDPNEPPPEGYDGRYDSTARAREEDARYAAAVERWSAENCIDQRHDNAVAGAVIGGVLGALLGSSVAGRGSHTAGAFVGGAAGAMAGSAIGASQTSPGCPPGYVVREGAPPFRPGVVFVGGYGYAAPPGYRPWIWTGGRWAYRPYPYHRYWYRREHWRDRDGWRDRR